MSKLDELIAELCPDGVEYRKVGDIANISRGKVMSKDFLKENAGEYPVYSSQTENEGKLGSINTYMYDGEYLTWTTDGANAGTVFFRSGKFSVTNVCGVIDNTSEDVDIKYLYYVLNREAPSYVNSGMGNPKLMSNVMARISLPVPPLEIQREIVRVLDSFTLLTAELTAELTARKKQYEFYRDKLLSFDIGTRFEKLGDTCNMKAGKAILSARISEKPSKITPYKCFGGNGVRGYVSDVSHHGEFPIIGRQGALCGNVNYATGDFYATEHAVVVESKGAYLQRFLYHLLTAMNLNQYKSQGAQPGLAVKNLENLIAPVPKLDVQERLVRVLDNFESICTDLNIGLPAEIEARQKQYEYYRDLLLTFAETGSTLVTDRQTELNAIRLIQYVFGYAFLTLNQISENCDRQRKPVRKGKREAGQYPYYGASGIVDYVSDYIFDGEYLLVSEDGANLLARSTPIAFSISGKTWVNNHAHVLKFENYELRRYVEIYLNSIDLSKYISGGAQPKLSQENMNKIIIPVPGAKKVKYIVNILDRFDALCNDLSAGLPAEIEARRKQYEYYRDKLLSFEELQKK